MTPATKNGMQRLNQLPKTSKGMLEPAILIENTKYASWLSDLSLKPQFRNCVMISDFSETKAKSNFFKPPGCVGIARNASSITRNAAITQIS